MSPNLSHQWNFKESEEVSPADAPSVVIPPPPPPPPPTLVSGALIDLGGGEFAGATNFSEFSVAAGLPAGITQFGIGSTSPVTHAIANDSIEGNYFSMDGHSTASEGYGYGYDAFDNIFEFGEILTRIFTQWDLPNSGRRSIGGAARINGLIGRPEIGPDFDCLCQGLSLNGATFNDNGLYQDAGSGSLPSSGAVQESFVSGQWMWLRMRVSENGADDDWIITSWYGSQVDALDISGQPGPDSVNLARFRTIFGIDALGWANAAFGDGAEQRISYLSFSTDPTVTPPPLPATVIGGP